MGATIREHLWHREIKMSLVVVLLSKWSEMILIRIIKGVRINIIPTSKIELRVGGESQLNHTGISKAEFMT